MNKATTWSDLDEPIDLEAALKKMIAEIPPDPMRGTQAIRCGSRLVGELRAVLEEARPSTRLLVGAVPIEIDEGIPDGCALFVRYEGGRRLVVGYMTATGSIHWIDQQTALPWEKKP